MCAMQVALWLVWKSTSEKQELALPLTMFGASLALGNWWNGKLVWHTEHNQCMSMCIHVCICDAYYSAATVAPSTQASITVSLLFGHKLTCSTKMAWTRSMYAIITAEDNCSHAAVVFMGRHQLKPSLKWMSAFWLSIAGEFRCSIDSATSSAAFLSVHFLCCAR